MLNKLWGGLILVSLFVGVIQSLFSGPSVINAMAVSVFDSAKLAIEIAIGLIGGLTLWLGLFAVAQASGVVALFAKTTQPVLRRLLPGLPAGHPAHESISMGIGMSMLGIDNGATPIGLKAMRELESLNSQPGVATQAQQLFLMMMTTSLTIFPISIINYRVAAGAANPADIFLPLIFTGYIGLIVGLVYMSFALKVSLFTRAFIFYALAFISVLFLFGYFANSLPKGLAAQQAALLGNMAILGVLAWFIIAGLVKKVPIFEIFVKGATEGFTIAVQLMPYLVGMLLAVGLLKASGVFGVLQASLAPLFAVIGVEAWWAQMVPHGLMKLFSGSAARSMMIESFTTNGVDSFAGYLSAMIQGAFDTTFYVFALYAAAAKLTNLGHAVIGALIANLTSFIVAGLSSKIFF
jgi:spore maturation protein SpmA